MTRDPPIALLGMVAAHAVMYNTFCIFPRDAVSYDSMYDRAVRNLRSIDTPLRVSIPFFSP